MFVCEEGCQFTEYDFIEERALCSCYTKIKLPLISEIKVDKGKLYSNFLNIKNIANIQVLKCINLFFDNKNIFNNPANYLLVILFSAGTTSVFIFSFYSFKKIKNYFGQSLTKNDLNKADANIIIINEQKQLKHKNSKSYENKLINEPPNKQKRSSKNKVNLQKANSFQRINSNVSNITIKNLFTDNMSRKNQDNTINNNIQDLQKQNNKQYINSDDNINKSKKKRKIKKSKFKMKFKKKTMIKYILK